ncbi:glycogen debranching N-terminal domain-containing protein [Actinotalea sp.]|uniref:amylo-alpha-1,6-glucosidase n=1 Tax=Actinotalea sp. TaxID=1872145 RepID=UPI003562B913
MISGWAYEGGPPAPSQGVTLVDGTTFCIGDVGGTIHPGSPTGFFLRDTRYLSGWLVTLDGEPLEPLTVRAGADPFAATHLVRARPLPGRADSSVLVEIERRVGEGMCHQLTVHNLSGAEVDCTLAIQVTADFADLFEVKEGLVEPGTEVRSSVRDGAVWIEPVGDGQGRATAVVADGDPVLGPGRVSWRLALPPRARWTARAEVDVVVDGVPLHPSHRCGVPSVQATPAARMRTWRAAALEVTTPDAELRRTLDRSIEDLGSLRIFDPRHPDRVVVAAGAPWFMALFGRDALLTSLMLLPLDRELALGTLRTLAELQGSRLHEATEEEPGRIAHEARFGPRAARELSDGNVYYGTADATPLFVVLLEELHRFGAPLAELVPLLPHADRALEWVETYGDRDGDGFVEYERATPRGLVNQGWKDSFDGVNFADGRMAEAPIALSEVQGYTYAAYTARARLAEAVGDGVGARRWAERAATLKAAFNERFWLPDRGWYAEGLDRDKRPIDALTSNIGQCLWSGIVDDDRSGALAEHLLSARMFSGWGVRTLASDMGAYNPMSYHNGSVWPHDNALVAAGLMRYGHVAEARRVATAVLDAAEHFGGRLPELFCGFDREEFAEPVPYPTSCSPQAWAAAAPIHLLRTLLRLEPSVPTGTLRVDPVLPEQYLPLTLGNLKIADARVTVRAVGEDAEVTGLPEGIALLPERGAPRRAGD